MPRNVTKDKQIARVESASRGANLQGSGSAGGSLRQVNFTPGKREIYGSSGSSSSSGRKVSSSRPDA